MKKIIALAVILSLAVFLVFSAGGCSKVGRRVAESISEKTIEQAVEKGIESEGGQADVDISEEGVSIKTDEGTTSWGTGTEMPENFPKVVPVYPDMTPVSTMSWQEEGKDFFVIGFETDDPGEKVYNWYMDKFPAEGWTVEYNASSTSDGGNFYQVVADDGTYLTAVAITEESGSATSVGLNVGYK